jgi:serine/threonine protein kinase
VGPEVILACGHGTAADHWSLGILVYEMVSGENPFYFEGIDQLSLYTSICEDEYAPLPSSASDAARDLVDQLLKKDPGARLGSLEKGERDILEHRWFECVEQGEPSSDSRNSSTAVGIPMSNTARCRLFRYRYRHRLIKAPWIPTRTDDPLSTLHFDNWTGLTDRLKEKYPPLDPSEEALFEGF